MSEILLISEHVRIPINRGNLLINKRKEVFKYFWWDKIQNKSLSLFNMGLVNKLSNNLGKTFFVVGATLEAHMVYQYVFMNQCRHTPLTAVEKFAGLAFMVYGICSEYARKKYQK